jgi:hypothetical protein
MSNYEKKYKEALEKAKDMLSNKEVRQEDIEYLFPELKEDEDEKVRKMLIRFFEAWNKKRSYCWGISVPKILAWLEKQKEFVSADFDDVWETADCEELTAPLEKYSKDAIKKMCHAWYDKGIELERRNWIEKQGDPNPYSGVSFKYNGHTWGMCARDNGVEIGLDGQFLKYLDEQGEQKPQGKSALEAINEENVDNQFCVKSVDKVESKFKIGDWVFSSVLGTARIIGVNDSNEYQLEYIDGKQEFSSIDYVNYAYDKWNLQYVKNGDVLYSPEHKLLWIYKNKEEYHASINLNCANFVSICAYIVIPSDVCPATKEQRDVLENTMTKVGYKWNFEKKKLEIIDWSKHIKYEPNCPSITEKKSTWSEDDEKRMKNTLSVLNVQVCWDGATMEKRNPYQQEIDWLKSLKDRVGCTKDWKPSDEQIKHLTYVVYDAKYKDSIYTNGYDPYLHLSKLLQQLKKLKG